MTIYKGIAHQDTAGREPRRQRAHSIIIYIFIPMVSAGAAGNIRRALACKGVGAVWKVGAPAARPHPSHFAHKILKTVFFRTKRQISDN